MSRLATIGIVAALAVFCTPSVAQVVSGNTATSNAQPDVLVVPQQRVFALNGTQDSSVRIEDVTALVTVIEQVAKTVLRVRLENTASWQQEAQIMLPVPDGAVILGFDFGGSSDTPTARLLPRDEARNAYESLVRRVIDPALLEFAGHDVIQSSVFPVPAGGKQSVELVWEQVLESHGSRVDYTLPRSQIAGYTPMPWNIGVRLSTKDGIATTWSPSHYVNAARLGRGQMFIQLTGNEARKPGSFQISWLRGVRGLQTGFLACPHEAKDGGYVMMLGGLPDERPADPLPREVTLVLDRSGSMRGQKFEQALEAARQILEGLSQGEAFNIIDYSSNVASFAPAPVIKADETLAQARQYLDLLDVNGGTNIHGALRIAVSQTTREGFLPVVLFLTDGLPTEGIRDETRIREDTRTANHHDRRLFTFGVGDDVNAPLLDALAEDSRALSTYVHPKEDVEVKVGAVYDRLFGPVMTEPVLTIHDADGTLTSLRIREPQPATMPDLYAGDQLIIAARYLGTEPVIFRITGQGSAGEEVIDAVFDPATADRSHDFVPRMWASRRIASLVDEVRLAGVQPGKAPSDARLGELVQEIVALSTEFGVLTEYTAFMATEGSSIWNPTILNQRVRKMLYSRAQNTRTGRGAVSQAVNMRRMRQGAKVDRLNAFLDSNLNTIEISAVRIVDDLTFFRLENKWIDARLVTLVQEAKINHEAEKAAAKAAAAAAGDAPDATVAVAEEVVPDADAPEPEMSAIAKRLEPLTLPVETIEIGTENWIELSRRLERDGRAGVLALPGVIYLLVENLRVIVTPPPPALPESPQTTDP
jgi:Ca-activated chloride channel family protein